MEFEFEQYNLTLQQYKDLIYEEILLYHFKDFKESYTTKISNGQSVIQHVVNNENAKLVGLPLCSWTPKTQTRTKMITRSVNNESNHSELLFAPSPQLKTKIWQNNINSWKKADPSSPTPSRPSMSNSIRGDKGRDRGLGPKAPFLLPLIQVERPMTSTVEYIITNLALLSFQTPGLERRHST